MKCKICNLFSCKALNKSEEWVNLESNEVAMIHSYCKVGRLVINKDGIYMIKSKQNIVTRFINWVIDIFFYKKLKLDSYERELLSEYEKGYFTPVETTKAWNELVNEMNDRIRKSKEDKDDSL